MFVKISGMVDARLRMATSETSKRLMDINKKTQQLRRSGAAPMLPGAFKSIAGLVGTYVAVDKLTQAYKASVGEAEEEIRSRARLRTI
jgi:hypothetical protein